MSRWYLDTSAALKLLMEERESQALVEEVERNSWILGGSLLLETELRRAVFRNVCLSQSGVTNFLKRIDLYDVPAVLFREAGLLATPHLRSLDALHLAAALRMGADGVITYDQQMGRAARDLGFDVASPGRE